LTRGILGVFAALQSCLLVPHGGNCIVNIAENVAFTTAVGAKLRSRPTPECLKSVSMPQKARVENPGR
jgi:hypothetical protein